MTGKKITEEAVDAAKAEAKTKPSTKKQRSDAIARMNKEYAVTWAGSDAIILREHFDPTTKRNVVSFVKHDAVALMLADQFITTGDDDKKKQLFPYWLKNPRRRKFDAVVFEPWAPGKKPKTNPTYYNLFRGWGVEPDKSKSCKLFLKHVREVICSGDDTHTEWLLGWMAQSLREPDMRPGTAIVLRQGQGAGKGIFVQYYGLIWGLHFLHLQRSDDLTGRFNAHIKDALLVYADEIMFGGDRKNLGVLNAVITENYVMIEKKFNDKLRVRNHMRLIMSTNEDWSVPTGHDARRFFMPVVSDAHQGDRKYFDALVAEMNNGGPEALLAYLMTFDYSHLDLKTVPKTAELARQKHRSMTSGQKFWFEALNNSELVDRNQLVDAKASWRTEPLWVSRKAFYSAYEAHAKKDRYHDSPKLLWDRIADTCKDESGRPLMKRDRNAERTFRDPNRIDYATGEPRTYQDRVNYIPSLIVCRDAFERWWGQPVEWGDDTDMTIPDLGVPTGSA